MKIQAWIAPFCAGWIALAAHAGDNTTIPQLGCTTPVTVFNTGTDAAGAALDLGAQESTWFYNFRHQLVGGPPVSLEPQANADGA
ncbi:hypothetical protein SDC9_91367 [bioreactor metagenome]|uniref:Uncharacterized protein n=1 Tax=bioreactor metagenome TaxID=1076179 RepID=A0A644ZW99_9ZZZZ